MLEKIDAIGELRLQLQSVLAFFELLDTAYFSDRPEDLVEALRATTVHHCEQMQLNMNILFGLLHKTLEMARALEQSMTG